MARTIEVTPAQVSVARLLVKQATERGEPVSAGIAAMASATPLTAGRNTAGSAAEQPPAAGRNGQVNGHVKPTGRATAQPPRPRYAG